MKELDDDKLSRGKIKEKNYTILKKSNEIEDFKERTDAIGVKFTYKNLRVLDLEWILRKIQLSSKEVIKNHERKRIPRFPMKIELNGDKLRFTPFATKNIKTKKIQKLLTEIFKDLKKSLEKSKQRKNLQKIEITRLKYINSKFNEIEKKEFLKKQEKQKTTLSDFV
ncbi:MAG: hypothetical protein BTN85_0567 [Candidatus Methanohalarchaeum thermophilum]|uniref:Uncharacterized protein n=1 Tax=Methanohalarchaeum thermophilum TaxID=1903181 RepID=A0A1Q6DUU6_METT1|nr:MAG: hypothetical protein BTN85_0567 [Candidatus Methanohalarchaeum thermophilum]